MIKNEALLINGKQFCRHYSTNNKYIQKVGTDEIYSEAVDLMPCTFGYIATNEDIHHEIQQK